MRDWLVAPAILLAMVMATPALAGPALAGPALAGPPCWTRDAADSQFEFTGKQAGAPAHGRFRRFTVQACFDPDQAQGELEVEVDLDSLDTRNATRDATLRGPEFLDVSHYPRARYQASDFESLGGQHYRARGTLTLHGVSQPLAVPFTFRVDNDGRQAEARGTAALDRRDFDVGQGRWAGTRWVGAEVELSFSLKLVPASPP